MNAYPDPKKGAERAHKNRGWTIWKEFIARVKNPFIRIFDGKVCLSMKALTIERLVRVFCDVRDEGGTRHNNTDLSRNWVEIPEGYWISARFWVHRGRFFTRMRRKHLKLKGKFVGHGQRHRSQAGRRRCGEMVDVHIKSAIGAKINRAVISPCALCSITSPATCTKRP